MTDIVKRLREIYPATYAFTDMPHIGQEAADEIERLRNELADLRKAKGEPVAWIRFCSDGCYEGPIMHKQMEEVRKKSGAWTPLYQ